MQLVLFDNHTPGLLKGDSVVDVTAAVRDVAGRNGQETMEAIIENFERLRPALERELRDGPALPLSAVRLRAPLPRPGKIMMMGANYLEGTSGPALPIWGFLKSPEAVLDPGGTCVLPKAEARVFHHEAELAVVIGRRGKDISQEHALEHVFGYMVGVDVSGRFADMPNSLVGKSYDTFSPFGPAITTADEIADPHQLQVRLSVSGEPRQDYNTSDMGHRIPECIEYWSAITTINPGDVLFCGTNHQGLGALQDDDRVEMTIDGLGTLTFTISDPLERVWPRGLDPAIGQTVRERILSGHGF
ncbi:MAG: FAA hydrolase family protein [Chloroflexi bacterium]|nr:FAA hydrolase family protein [Chloroflexota bacterium]